MVCTLRSDHHGYTRRLDNTWVIGADRLLLNHGDSLELVVCPNPSSSLRPQSSVLRALPNLFEYFLHKPNIAKFTQTSIHQYRDHGACFYSVYPKIVCNEIHPGEGIRIFQATVGAHQPQCFVFNRGRYFVAVLIDIDIAALDRTTGHTGMGGLTPSFQLLLPNVLPAHGHGFIIFNNSTLTKITHRQATQIILNIGH